MFQFPPIPSWDGLHPLIVHFPIALLLVAPVFIVVGTVVSPSRGRSYLVAAMVLLLLGTAAVFVAVETGEAAARLAERSPSMAQVLETHESLAERTRVVFGVLSAVFVALLVVPRLLRRTDTRLTTTVLPLAFLVLYGAGALLLVNTAHNGGRLVHQFGVRALMPPALADAGVAPSDETEHDRH
jgi:uncharacterized membrane protein